MRKKRTPIGRSKETRRQIRFETLEPRVVLHGQLAWADTTQLTISFAPEGTDIGGAPNELHSLFDAFGPLRWKRKILTAFQTWAAPSAANIGLVEEQIMRSSDETTPVEPLPIPAGGQVIGVQPPGDGDVQDDGNPNGIDDDNGVGVLPPEVGFPFGTPGPRTDDPRFGDIRIGARPLSQEIKAIAVSHDTVISGTWSGDVIFNSRSRFTSLDEILGVALHEAGHVFGLQHSEDPESPMFEHFQNGILRPTEQDYVDLMERQGERTVDQYEGQFGNDTVDTATEIEIPRTISLVDGAVPAILFAGLHHGADSDFYKIPKIGGNTGSVLIQVQTLGISQLAPSLAVFTPDGSTGVHNTRIGGSVIELQLPTIDYEEDLYLQVSSARGPNDIFSVGDYSLVVTFESTSVIDAVSVDRISTDRVRTLSQIEIQSLLDPNDNLLNNTGVIDETPATSIDLAIRPGFDPFTFYEAVGSISGANDHDFYKIRAPFIPEDSGDVFLQTNLRSLQNGTLMPSAAVYHSEDRLVESEIIANANGEFVLQSKLESNVDYFIEIRAADAFTEFQRGNYRLMVYFTDVKIELEETVGGEAKLTERKGHKLHVAQSHLFHFALDTSVFNDVAGSQIQKGVVAQIFGKDSQPIYQVSAPLGTRRTSHSVLLSPGTYVVQVFGITLESERDLTFSYKFLASQISDPIGVPPDDPTNDPLFECPGEEGKYCYPGGVESYDPFLWEEFIETIPDPPDLPIEELIDALFGDWWNWYWSQVSNNDAPIAIADSEEIDPGNTLNVSELNGVLNNDTDANGDTLKSILVDDVTSGDLTLGLDGEFIYTPNPGFVGTDRFRYAAYDYVDPSDPVWVTLRVVSSSGVEGDFDGDGERNVVDVNLLSAAIQGSQDLVFDINQDNEVNLGDLDYLIHDVFQTTYGDTNLDGTFNSIDIILTFQKGHYEDLIEDNSMWGDGDWNADSDFTSSDIIRAFNDGGYNDPAVEEDEDIEFGLVKNRRIRQQASSMDSRRS